MASTQDVIIVTPASVTTPVTGLATADMNTAALVPQLGRNLYLTLSGTWTGTVQLQRSTDAGATWNAVTYGGGLPWGKYTANCDEVVETPTDGASQYRLNIDIATGSLRYRLAQ